MRDAYELVCLAPDVSPQEHATATSSLQRDINGSKLEASPKGATNVLILEK